MGNFTRNTRNTKYEIKKIGVGGDWCHWEWLQVVSYCTLVGCRSSRGVTFWGWKIRHWLVKAHQCLERGYETIHIERGYETTHTLRSVLPQLPQRDWVRQGLLWGGSGWEVDQTRDQNALERNRMVLWESVETEGESITTVIRSDPTVAKHRWESVPDPPRWSSTEERDKKVGKV